MARRHRVKVGSRGFAGAAASGKFGEGAEPYVTACRYCGERIMMKLCTRGWRPFWVENGNVIGKGHRCYVREIEDQSEHIRSIIRESVKRPSA